VLDHLGVKPGDKVAVALTGDGRVELAATSTGHDLMRARGILRRPMQRQPGQHRPGQHSSGQKPVSLQEMQEAIEAGRTR